MSKEDLVGLVEVLREKFTLDSPATLEQVAAICGIDVEARHSYREVLDLSELLVFYPDIVRIWVNGERRYYALRAPAAD